jgi:hypothetical protein
MEKVSSQNAGAHLSAYALSEDRNTHCHNRENLQFKVSANKSREFFPSRSYFYYLQTIVGFSVNIFLCRQAIIG